MKKKITFKFFCDHTDHFTNKIKAQSSTSTCLTKRRNNQTGTSIANAGEFNASWSNNGKIAHDMVGGPLLHLISQFLLQMCKREQAL
jgi:hypothetical protein